MTALSHISNFAGARQREDALAMLVEQVPAILWTTDKDLTFVSARGRGLRDLKLTPEDLIGRTVPPFDRGETSHSASALLGESVVYEAEWQDHNLDIRIEPLRNLDGDIIGTLGLAINVTERRRGEESLRDHKASARSSEERFRTLTEATTQAVWTTGPTGEVVEDLPTWRTLTGQTRGEILGSGWLDAVHPDDRQRVNDLWNIAIRQKTLYSTTFRLRTASGEYREIASRGVPMLDEKGEALAWIGAASDITERISAERARQQSDERFRLVVQATSDVVWDWSLRAGGLWWSEGFRTQFGHPVDGALDVTSRSGNIHPDDQERVKAGIDHAIESGQHLWSDVYRFRKGDGTYAEVTDRGLIARDADGRAYRMLGAMVDVTRQRALEAQLEQVKRVASLGQLAASMAHEFNNVLMGIQPFVDVIRRLVPDQKDVQKSAARILQSVTRGRGVTDEILRFTRRVAPVKNPIDVREWLSSFLPEAEALVGNRFPIELRAGSEELAILGDISQLNQVMANLIINARDASAPGQPISIAAGICCSDGFGLDLPAGYVHVTVRDRGTGMDRPALEHVFDPLFTTKRAGTGLGLAICLQVITAHDGKIIAESAPGQGTTFHILLPSASVRTQPGSAGPREKRRAVPRSVLIVEDERVVADGLRVSLALEGVTTSVVYLGADAIAAIETNDPEVVLLDIGLPDIHGVVMARDILGRWPHRRLIFMTGHYDRSELTELLALPHVGFLQKPFDTATLLDALAAVGHPPSPVT
jgi:PAS domain S-box-containing protein